MVDKNCESQKWVLQNISNECLWRENGLSGDMLASSWHNLVLCNFYYSHQPLYIFHNIFTMFASTTELCHCQQHTN